MKSGRKIIKRQQKQYEKRAEAIADAHKKAVDGVRRLGRGMPNKPLAR